MSDVPVEIVTFILRRLPVKPLLRFRSVCKPWCALIDSPDFVKSHLDQSLQNYTNLNLVLGGSGLCSVDFDSLDTAVKLAHPLNKKLDDSGTEILGSCHGLLCLLICENEFALWNPSTRRHKKLPASGFDYQTTQFNPGNHFFIHGFGYDLVNDDYKFVRIIQFYLECSDSFESELEVYSSRTNSWRITQDFPYYILNKQDYGKLANGALHWVMSQKPDFEVGDLIVAFDLASEEYRVVPQPQSAENGFDMSVGVLGERLCMHCNYDKHDYDQQYFDVWVMNEYGVKDSWTKLLSIAQRDDIGLFEFLKPIAYSKSGVQVLFKTSEDFEYDCGSNSFFWYDLETKNVKLLEINDVPDYFEPFMCVESLVRLKRGGKRDAKMQRALEKRRNLKKAKKGLLVAKD